MLRLYNTLSKQLEDVPKKDHLNLYTCGPTVYNHAHIGNLRSFIVADLLYRTLKADGYNPRWVMNVTDIDDKTIKGTLEQYGASATVAHLREFTGRFFESFIRDLREVKVAVEDIRFIRVTDVLPQIQEFVASLLEKGYAYKAEDGSTYFSIEKYQADFGDYGLLAGEKFLEGKKVGAQVQVDEYDKENLSDFALWKAWTEKDGQMYWEHNTLGKGRPGWHIECSAINRFAFGGEPTDIHTGGVDLIFPHHTNELAQSQALFGKGNFVRHWSHAEHLLVDGKKMAKSLGNFYTLSDLASHAPHTPWALRYHFLQSHYRTQQNYTHDALVASSNGVAGLINSVRDGNDGQKVSLEALLEDLNAPKALASSSPAGILSSLLGIDPAGLTAEQLPLEIQELSDRRAAARNGKDFALSDSLRRQIEAKGFEVLDTAEGQKIRRKM